MLYPSQAIGVFKRGLQVQTTFNIFNIFNISPERSIFLREAFEHIQHIQHFCRKKQFLGKNASFSCNVECWVPLRQLGGWGGLWVGGCWAAKAESKLEKEKEREREICRGTCARTHTHKYKLRGS